MTAEGHFIFALASTILAKKIVLTTTLAQGDWWHIIAGGLLTCLLPDIDHPNSVLGQRFTWLSTPIARLCGHRGFTHSLLAIIAGILLFTLRLPSQSVITGVSNRTCKHGCFCCVEVCIVATALGNRI